MTAVQIIKWYSKNLRSCGMLEAAHLSGLRYYPVELGLNLLFESDWHY